MLSFHYVGRSTALSLLPPLINWDMHAVTPSSEGKLHRVIQRSQQRIIGGSRSGKGRPLATFPIVKWLAMLDSRPI